MSLQALRRPAELAESSLLVGLRLVWYEAPVGLGSPFLHGKNMSNRDLGTSFASSLFQHMTILATCAFWRGSALIRSHVVAVTLLLSHMTSMGPE